MEVSWFTFNKQRTHLHNIVGELFIRDYKLWKYYYHYGNELLLPKIKKSFSASFKNIIGIKDSTEQASYADRFKAPSPHSVNYRFNVKEMEVVFPEHIAGEDELLLNDFYSIVRICKDRNIDLVLFTAPEDENYCKLQKDIQQVKKIYHDVTISDSNVFYLDYSLGGNLHNKKFEKWLSNSHHINESILFSKELISDIKELTYNRVYKN